MAYGSREPFRFCHPTRTGTCVLQRRERNGRRTRSETAGTEKTDLLQSEGRSQPAPASAKIVFSVVDLNAVNSFSVLIITVPDTGYFPPNARPWQEGKAVQEGAIPQRLSNRRFRLILQRSHSSAPAVLAAKKERDFAFARNAIRAFVRSEWPNGIDGIRISKVGVLGI
jgi:hypothetical protein